MKIGLVRRGFSPTGGAEHYLRRFARALADAGHQAVGFVSPEWPREGPWQLPGERCEVAGAGPRAFADALAARRPEERCDYLFSLERVWRCDCYRAGDGVHRAWLERRARHEPAWRRWWRRGSGKHRDLLALEAALLGPAGGARRVVANSHLVREEILRCYGGPPGRVSVVYNGLAPAEGAGPEEPVTPAARAAARAELGLGEADRAVLFVGSGWERKGLRFAVAAVARLAATAAPTAAAGVPVLLVAGRGDPSPYRPRGGGAAGRGYRVSVLGPRADLAAVHAAADVFVLPTLYDPFSNACLEAWAAGLPVVTSAANGFAEVMEPGVDGSVVDDPADVPGLAAALADWTDPARCRDEAGRTARRRRAARYGIGDNLRRTLDLFGAGPDPRPDVAAAASVGRGGRS